MNYKYQDRLDQLDRNGKLAFENEFEVRVAMLKLCSLVEHLLNNRAKEILQSSKSLNTKEKDSEELYHQLNQMNDFRSSTYHATKALIISIKKPLHEPEDFDLLFPLDYCIEYCTLADHKITDQQIIDILNEIK